MHKRLKLRELGTPEQIWSAEAMLQLRYRKGASTACALQRASWEKEIGHPASKERMLAYLLASLAKCMAMTLCWRTDAASKNRMLRHSKNDAWHVCSLAYFGMRHPACKERMLKRMLGKMHVFLRV